MVLTHDADAIEPTYSIISWVITQSADPALFQAPNMAWMVIREGTQEIVTFGQGVLPETIVAEYGGGAVTTGSAELGVTTASGTTTTASASWVVAGAYVVVAAEVAYLTYLVYRANEGANIIGQSPDMAFLGMNNEEIDYAVDCMNPFSATYWKSCILDYYLSRDGAPRRRPPLTYGIEGFWYIDDESGEGRCISQEEYDAMFSSVESQPGLSGCLLPGGSPDSEN